MSQSINFRFQHTSVVTNLDRVVGAITIDNQLDHFRIGNRTADHHTGCQEQGVRVIAAIDVAAHVGVHIECVVAVATRDVARQDCIDRDRVVACRAIQVLDAGELQVWIGSA